MSRTGPRRPYRPLTIYGYRRRRPNDRRVWIAVLAAASLIALPKVINPVAEAIQRLSEVRDSVLSPRPPSPPKLAAMLTPGRAEADEVASALADSGAVSADSAIVERERVGAHQTQDARVGARPRRASTTARVDSAAKIGLARPELTAAPMVRQRLGDSRLRIDPK